MVLNMWCCLPDTDLANLLPLAHLLFSSKNPVSPIYGLCLQIRKSIPVRDVYQEIQPRHPLVSFGS